MQKILEIKGLKKYYPILGGVLQRKVADVKALDGIDLDIQNNYRKSGYSPARANRRPHPLSRPKK
jgi:ABC-type microcin C transport system duplicated ATPase subunit YejF